MSWGTRKRNFIIFIFLTVVFVIAGLVSFLFFYEEPTCFDGRQNGNETGIDCGGSCSLLCSSETFDPIVHWVRYFEISEGIYTAMAYIENQNINAGVKNVPYTFKLYDEANVILAEKTGFINLNPRQVTPLSVSGLNTGKLKPTRISFDFTGRIVWQKQDVTDPVLIIKDEEIFFENGVQKIRAGVLNTAFQNIKNVTFVVIVYDKQNNALAASSTLLDEVPANNTVNILFTWPTKFEDQVSRFEIIPLYQN